MDISNSIPATSIFNTWLENMEITSADDGALVDLSPLTEITIRLRDPKSHVDELMLTKSNGDIILPSIGILQWRVEVDQMGTLETKLYEVIFQFLDTDGTTTALLGTVSIVE